MVACHRLIRASRSVLWRLLGRRVDKYFIGSDPFTQDKDKLFGSFDDVRGKRDTNSFRWRISRLLYHSSGNCAE